jgi:tripartite ATP-independent transporter DctM subunit
VIYAVIGGVSVGKLFLGGVIPGIMIGVFLMLTNFIISSVKKDFPEPEIRVTLKQLILNLRDGIFALIAPIIIVGGIVGGFVTATEAGVLAADYALLAGLVYNGPRKLLKVLPAAFFDAMRMTALIMFIIGIATPMGWLIAIERIPQLIADGMIAITQSKYVFLLIVNAFLLLLGTVLETVPAMLITFPILLPVADHFGIDRVHFGLIAVYNLIVGMSTPPMGIGLYIVTGVAKIRLEEVIRAVLPFLIPLLIVLFVITYVPDLVLFLPNLLMGK